MVSILRKSTLFERFFLIIGIFVMFAGLYLLYVIKDFAQTRPIDVFMFAILWLILLLMVIITAIAENAREELAIIVSENSQEIKLLRQISHEQLEEIKLLRPELSMKKRK